MAITLLYELGEAVPDEARGQQQPAAAGPGPLAELVTALAHAVAAAGAAAPESGVSGGLGDCRVPGYATSVCVPPCLPFPSAQFSGLEWGGF